MTRIVKLWNAKSRIPINQSSYKTMLISRKMFKEYNYSRRLNSQLFLAKIWLKFGNTLKFLKKSKKKREK